ncbi:hypothetical protein HDZ31DRAFT_63446 [Schizophyllum fasciatum]
MPGPLLALDDDSFCYAPPVADKAPATRTISPASLSSFHSTLSSASRVPRADAYDSDASDEDSECGEVAPLTFEQANPSPSPDRETEYVISDVDGMAYPKGCCPEDLADHYERADESEDGHHSDEGDDRMEEDFLEQAYQQNEDNNAEDAVQLTDGPEESDERNADEVDQLIEAEIDLFEEDHVERKRSLTDAYRTPEPEAHAADSEHRGPETEYHTPEPERRGRQPSYRTPSPAGSDQPLALRTPALGSARRTAKPLSRVPKSSYGNLRLAPRDQELEVCRATSDMDTPYRPPPDSRPSASRRPTSRVLLAPEPDSDEDEDDSDEYVPDADDYMPEPDDRDDDLDMNRSYSPPRKPSSSSRNSGGASSSRTPNSSEQKRKRARSPSLEPPRKRRTGPARHVHGPRRNELVAKSYVDEQRAYMLENDLLECTICGKQCVRKPDLRRHLDTHKGIVWACIGVEASERDSWDVPKSAKEYGPWCDRRVGGCVSRFSRKDAVQRHIRSTQCYGVPCKLEDDELDRWIPYFNEMERSGTLKSGSLQ